MKPTGTKHEDCGSIAEEYESTSRYSGLMRRVFYVPLFVWIILGTIAIIGFVCGASLLLLNGSRKIAVDHETNVIKAESGQLMRESSQEPRVGVGCFVIRKGADGSPDSFLIGRRKGSHGAGACQLPGGHHEFNETFEECAIREIYEETGLTLKSVEFATATNDIMKEENRHYCTIFMKGVVEPEDVQNLRTMEPHKLDGDWAWITWEELLEGGDQIRPLFIPLQNLLATRPSFRI